MAHHEQIIIEVIDNNEGYRKSLANDHPLSEKEILSVFSNYSSGGDILMGNSTLVRLKALEGRRWRVKVDLITPNPTQPREYFKQAKLDELAQSIAGLGLKLPIEVVPYVDGNTVRFFITDGERRFRAISQILKEQEVPIVIKWEEDDDAIFITSFILNIEREGHNAVEIAKSVQRLCEIERRRDPGASKTKIYAAVTKKSGYRKEKIEKYLRILAFPDYVKQLIIDGLPPSSVFNVIRRRKRGRPQGNEDPEQERLRIMHAAALLIDEIEKDNVADDKSFDPSARKRVTKEQVAHARRRALLEGVTPEEELRLEIGRAMLDVNANIRRLLQNIGILTEPAHEEMSVASLRNAGEGKPPEGLRDMAKLLHERIVDLLEILDTAIEPPALDLTTNGQLYSEEYIERIIVAEVELSLERSNILRTLARASRQSTPTVYTPNQVAQCVECSVPSWPSHMRELRRILPAYGLSIDEWTVRERSERGDYKKFTGYRLAQLKES